MIKKSTLVCLIFFYGACGSPVFASDSQNISLRKQLETVLQNCENQYQALKLKESMFDPGVKPNVPENPGFFSSKVKKSTYETANNQLKKWQRTKEELDKRRIVFKKKTWQFAEFLTNEKLKLRSLPDSKLVEASRDFVSNCKRFSDGVSGFADWSIGKGPKGYDIIYQDWVKEK